MKLTLKLVEPSDYEFLYYLLKQRNPNECISHKKMPTYELHVDFLNTNPYQEFYIIQENGRGIGRMYVTTRKEIGIQFLKNVNRVVAFDTLFRDHLEKRGRVYFNVSPKNKFFQNYLKKKGAKVIQYTYEKAILSRLQLHTTTCN